MSRTLPLVAATVALAAGLVGCYSEIESADAPPPPQTETTTVAPAPVADVPSGGRSTLGKAKESAKSTVSDLEARQRDIEKQLEDDDG